MSDKIKIAVLMGGNSSERPVSYMSASNITASLDRKKYEVIGCDIPVEGGDWINDIMANKPDIVLNALHGGKGEDGEVQGVLDCLDIPYVGSGVSASALCIDKALCKTVMASEHIPVIDGILIKRGDSLTAAADSVMRIGLPVIVKPNKGGSSLGISIVNDISELKKAVELIFNEYNDDALAERYIKGKEVTCAVLEGENGPEVISLLDINKSDRDIFDYKAKYEDKVWSGGISNLPSYMQDMITGIAKKAFTCLGCSGYACVDMIIMEERVYVIEVNTLPGMTPQSLIPNAVKALDMTLGELFDRLIATELK